MATRLTIDPVTRIEGHLRIDVGVAGGRVNEAWASCTMWRGIENILLGRDPLTEVNVAPDNLRHQCESELKGKLIHMRTFYAANCNRPKEIAKMMVDSFPTFIAAMRGTLRLLGKRPPVDARAVVELVGGLIDINPTIFFDILEIRSGASLLPRGDEALSAFELYLTELASLTRFVDQIQTA